MLLVDYLLCPSLKHVSCCEAVELRVPKSLERCNCRQDFYGDVTALLLMGQ